MNRNTFLCGWIAACLTVIAVNACTHEPAQREPFVVEMGHCDTDTDCMRKFGGDGGPRPRERVDF